MQCYSEYVFIGGSFGGLLMEIMGVFSSQWYAYKWTLNENPPNHKDV